MQHIREGTEQLLRAHPATWPDRVSVRFIQFGPSSLDVEVFCWIVTGDIDEFRRIREEHFLSIMRIVEASGARFAFPTQTVMVRHPSDAR